VTSVSGSADMIEILVGAGMLFVLLILGGIVANIVDNRYARRRRFDRQVNRID
jgi:hypothetical protein